MGTIERTFSHLADVEEFVQDLIEEFGHHDAELIIQNLKDESFTIEDQLYDDFWFWFDIYLQTEAQPLLVVMFDSKNMMDGESGRVEYVLKHGIYSLPIQDDDLDDDLESDIGKFDRNEFHPIVLENLRAEQITFLSPIFTKEELVAIGESIIVFEKPYPKSVNINGTKYLVDFASQKLYLPSKESTQS